MIKLRRTRWAGNVVWEERSAFKVLVGKTEGKVHLMETVLRWILMKKDWGKRTGLICLRKGRKVFCCERVMSFLVS
jgi:hypothetical protein